ncbi:MAG: FAD:protein FMN transferase [Pseudomonadota bacterium]|nr:FAD:protein FMN transferase [Pseudomonadota bacterium]
MKRRTLLIASLGLGGAVLTRSATASRPDLQWRTRPLLALGTTVRLRAAHADAPQAERALDAATTTLRAVEASMSLFRDDSELSRLNRTGQLSAPSAHLLTVLREARLVSERSGGAFDVTVQPLWSAYDRARQAGRLPTDAERIEAQARTGWQQIRIDSDRVRFYRSDMAVTLNGIAQGYAADAVRATLQAHGIEHALIDTGEFGALGHNDRGQPWTVGVEDPHDSARLLTALNLDGRALATSADNRSTFTADRRHHHIIDPATGDSPPALSSVTVVADSAMRADALTKVMFMAGPERIAALARQWGVGVVWVDKQGRWAATAGLLQG